MKWCHLVAKISQTTYLNKIRQTDIVIREDMEWCHLVAKIPYTIYLDNTRPTNVMIREDMEWCHLVAKVPYTSYLDSRLMMREHVNWCHLVANTGIPHTQLVIISSGCQISFVRGPSESTHFLCVVRQGASMMLRNPYIVVVDGSTTTTTKNKHKTKHQHIYTKFKTHQCIPNSRVLGLHNINALLGLNLKSFFCFCFFV